MSQVVSASPPSGLVEERMRLFSTLVTALGTFGKGITRIAQSQPSLRTWAKDVVRAATTALTYQRRLKEIEAQEAKHYDKEVKSVRQQGKAACLDRVRLVTGCAIKPEQLQPTQGTIDQA